MTHSPSLSDALRRIGLAAGLAPAVLAPLLAACDADDGPVTELQGDTIDEPEQRAFDLHLEDDEGDATSSTTVGVDDDKEGSVAMSGPPILDILDPLNPGHVARYRVRNAPRGAQVTVYVGLAQPDRDPATVWVEDPQPLAGFVATGGVQDIGVIVPVDVLDRMEGREELAYEAVVWVDGEERVSEVVVAAPVTVVPEHAGIMELHPGIDPFSLEPGDRRRACIPAEEYGGVCPLVDDFDGWQALEVVSYALDAALPGDRSASACFEEGAFEGSCCYVVDVFDPLADDNSDVCEERANNGPPVDQGWWGGGRPFATAAGPREAPVRGVGGWVRGGPIAPVHGPARTFLLDGWTTIARAEHASVASFARLTLQLMALGVPADLVSRATRAQQDEVRHAELAFGVVSQLAGRSMGPGPLDLDGALPTTSDPAEILRAAIVEGCIQETVSYLQVRDAAMHAEPALAEMLHGIADDEERHAQLSWALVRWMLEQDPPLMAVAEEAFASFEPGPVPEPSAVDGSRWGIRPAERQHALGLQVLERVVQPAWHAMLADVAQA